MPKVTHTTRFCVCKEKCSILSGQEKMDCFLEIVTISR